MDGGMGVDIRSLDNNGGCRPCDVHDRVTSHVLDVCVGVCVCVCAYVTKCEGEVSSRPDAGKMESQNVRTLTLADHSMYKRRCSPRATQAYRR